MVCLHSMLLHLTPCISYHYLQSMNSMVEGYCDKESAFLITIKRLKHCELRLLASVKDKTLFTVMKTPAMSNKS